jgi:hypothetical protein
MDLGSVVMSLNTRGRHHWSKVFDARVYSTHPHQMTGAFWAGSKKASPEVKKGIYGKKRIGKY